MIPFWFGAIYQQEDSTEITFGIIFTLLFINQTAAAIHKTELFCRV